LKKHICKVILLAILILTSCDDEIYETHEGNYERFSTQSIGLFDTAISFMAYAETREDFNHYTEVLFNKLEELHKVFTIFEPHPNNLYMLNAGHTIEASEVLISLLQIGKEAYEISGGRLNIAIGPITNIWSNQRNSASPALPSLEELQEAANYIDIEGIIIEDGTVRLNNPNMKLDVGTIGKAYAMVHATNHLIEQTGISSFLLSVGGDIIAHNAPLSNRETWVVGIEDPDNPNNPAIRAVNVVNTAFFASGDYRRFFTVGDVRFSHIIDPETLFPANYFKSVNVIHEDAIMAEILTTALFLMPIEEAQEMANYYNARVLWIDLEGNIITTPDF